MQPIIQSWLCEVLFVTQMDINLLMQLQNLDGKTKPLIRCKLDGSKDSIGFALLFYNACTPLSLSTEICNLENNILRSHPIGIATLKNKN